MYNQAQVGFDIEHYNCHKPTNALCFKSHIGSRTLLGNLSYEEETAVLIISQTSN